jgi:hypothetical protein
VVGANKLNTLMRIKVGIACILFLTGFVFSCKTSEKFAASESILKESVEKVDYIVKPESATEKKESTDYLILEIEQQGKIFLDITVMPKIGCNNYSYEVKTLPMSSQGTKFEIVLQLIQNCSEQTMEIKKKNIVRVDLTELIPKSTTEKTIQISFTSSSEKFNFNLAQ